MIDIMKKIVYSLFLILTGVATLVSCQKDESDFSLSAVIADKPNVANNSNAKVYIENDNSVYYARWHNQDYVNINGQKCTLSVNSTAAAALINRITPSNSGYTAVYPYSESAVAGPGATEATVTIPASQSYHTAQADASSETEYQVVDGPMVAYCGPEDKVLKFHNAAGIIRVHVTNNSSDTKQSPLKVHYISVETTDGSSLAGSGTVSTNIENPSLSVASNGSKSVTLDCCDDATDKHPVIAVGSSRDFYLAVAPFSSKQLKIKVMTEVTEENTKKFFIFTSTTSESGSVTRNQIGHFSMSLTNSNYKEVEFLGAGTKDCPFLITNLTDLNTLRTVTNAGTSGYCGNDVYYKQTDVINITSSTWGSNSSGNYAVGNSSNAFTANYDGDGKYIHLAISNSTTYSNLGVFGIANGNATIKNVKVSGSISTSANYCNDGCVVGQITGPVTIENCYNECDINDTYSGSNSLYGRGGIVGLVKTANESDKVKILSSTNIGTIEATTNCAGGIVGNINTGTVTVKNCTNGSELDASAGTIITQENYAGGICGYVYYTASGSQIDGCINYGTVKNKTTTSEKNNYLGGILGYFRTTTDKEITIKNCENHGAIDQYRYGKTGYKMYAGGIVSSLFAANNESGSIHIIQCQNAGAITSQTANSYGAEMRAGGIIGHITGSGGVTASIEDCCNSGVIESKSTSGNKYAGGIIGVLEVSTISTITNCHNTGTITNGIFYFGGIVGYLANDNTVTITNCYNTGNFSNITYSYSYPGGIVGYITNYPSTVSIKNCYYIGNDIPSNRVGGAIGFVGNNGSIDITIQNFYAKFGNNKNPRGVIIGQLAGSNPTCNVNNCFVDNNHRTVPAAYNTAISPTNYYAYDDSYNLKLISDGTTSASYEGETTLLGALNYYRTHPTQATWKTWLQESTSVVPHF